MFLLLRPDSDLFVISLKENQGSPFLSTLTETEVQEMENLRERLAQIAQVCKEESERNIY